MKSASMDLTRHNSLFIILKIKMIKMVMKRVNIIIKQITE